MSNIQNVKCDICDKIGILGQGWKILRDFNYVKHACPKCVNETDDYGGSHLYKYRLASKVRNRIIYEKNKSW